MRPPCQAPGRRRSTGLPGTDGNGGWLESPTMGRPLRIALLSYRSKPHSGGQGVYVRALSRALTALGHGVAVFSGQPYPELDDGVPLTRVPSLDLYREPDPFRTPRPAEFRDRIDVLEYATMCTAGFPPVPTVHPPVPSDRDLGLTAAPSLRRRLTLRRWYGFTRMQARVAPQLDGVTTVSGSSRRDIETHLGVPADAIRVVPVGIDPDVFTPPPADRPRDPCSIVVTTSADVPLKGLVHLLEAVAKLRTERPGRLTVVGSARPGGPAEAAPDRLALRDAVRFTGPLPEADLVRLLQSAAVVAIPSLYEGFSLPAIEAMACGTALVTTDAGALPEVVGSKAGLRVRAGDVGELTAALQLVLDSPSLADQLGRAGRRRVLASYTWRSTAERTAEWYREVLHRKGRRG